MNINEQKQEQRIRSIYKNTHAPDAVKNRTEETLKLLKQQNETVSAMQKKTGRRKKPLSFKKAAVLAAAAILCISGTVFAAERIYQMQIKKEKEYQANLQISSDEELPREVPETILSVNYIPEGFIENPEKKHFYIDPGQDEAGYYTEGPWLADQADPLTIFYVEDTEPLTINGHDAVYVRTTYHVSAVDPDWKNETVYILYEDINQIFSVSSWGHADKDELLKMAENISLTPTGNMTAADELPLWSEFVDALNEPREKGDESASAEDDYYFTEASEEQMANTHQIGEKFKIHSFLDADMTDIELEATVTDIQTADDLSLLTKEEAIPDYMAELIGPDGKLISDTLYYMKDGDGVSTMPELVRTEETSLKLVYATVEFSNPGTEAVHNAWFMVPLIPIVKEGNTYKIFNRADDTCDYVENEHIGVRYEMLYHDISGGQKHNNYIPEIKPGESVTMHLAWIVNEDELDKLYLDFRGDGIFSEEGLKTGYVRIGDRVN